MHHNQLFSGKSPLFSLFFREGGLQMLNKHVAVRL